MNGQSTGISREEFDTEAAIERNYQRLKRIGDRGRTAELFEDERIEARAEVDRQEAAHRARRARGDDLPLFAA